MSLNVPDRWVVVEISDDKRYVKKVLAGWYGGYTGNDSWKLSSGITEEKDCGDYIEFTNNSGSVYKCFKASQGMTSLSQSIYEGLKRQETGKIKINLIVNYESEVPVPSKRKKK